METHGVLVGEDLMGLALESPTEVFGDFGAAGDPVQLNIKNSTSDYIILCWIDSQHRLRQHYTIEPGQTHREHAYAQHLFLGLSDRVSCERLEQVDEKQALFLFQPQTSSTLEVTQTGQLVLQEPHTSQGPVDSSNKHYEILEIAGFTVYFETGVFQRHPGLEQALVEDLVAVTEALDEQQLDLVRAKTRIYLNESLMFGPIQNPIKGKATVFHVSEHWLQKNGLSTDKCGSIEVYNVTDYLTERNYWATGGLLMHEFAHAYHHYHCPKAMDCDPVIVAYNQALTSGIYESVDTHEGPPRRAYALTNHKEYFAELSVAFLHKSSKEMNRWFPYNSEQLQQFDPVGYEMCDIMWTGQCSENKPDHH